jgi:gamma-glutamyl hydrolase
MEMNEREQYFPLWGTCLGFELLTYLSAGGDEHRAHCSSTNQALPLVFKLDYKESRLFKNAPQTIVKILESEAVTANFHQFCVTEKVQITEHFHVFFMVSQHANQITNFQNLTDYNLDKEWRVMSVNNDWNGLEFISTIEHRFYPFYGVQFHPEKNLFEWVRNKNISHTANAVSSAQYFADFFVSEARKSSNAFKDTKTQDEYVIYNFAPSFTGAKGSAFEQCYLFDKDIKYETSEDMSTANGSYCSFINIILSLSALKFMY